MSELEELRRQVKVLLMERGSYLVGAGELTGAVERIRNERDAALDLLERFAEPAKPDQTTWRAVRALLKKAGRR